MSLETHLFTRQLNQFSSQYNKIDKNLASVLYDAVDAISRLLENAEVQMNDESADIFEIIPAIESEICQAHRSYVCNACNQSVRMTSKGFQEHFFGNKHLKALRAYELDNSKGARGKASLQMNGSTHSLNSKQLVPKKERLNSLPAGPKRHDPDNLPNKLIAFLATEDIEDFTMKMLMEGTQLMNSKVADRVCNLIYQRLVLYSQHVKVLPFGSMVIGLGRIGGDLDIFIDIGNCYCEKPSKRRMKDSIFQTQRILSQNKNHWDQFEPVTKARTPLLRTYCQLEKIDCDLSFSNGLSHCNTNLIQYFIELQPVCKKIVVFIKFWVKAVQLGLNSYLISLMVIFYLQQEKILPAVAFLQSLAPPWYIDGWHANFTAVTLHDLNIPIATDFKKYLLGFFKFYGSQFDYQNHIISILAGQPVDKRLFNHGKEQTLPPMFQRFAMYMEQLNLDEADEVEDLFANYKPLVIQDPFELCHNVAKGVQELKLKKMQLFMQRTLEILSNRQEF